MALREMPCAAASCLNCSSNCSKDAEVRQSGAAANACEAPNKPSAAARSTWKCFMVPPKVSSMRLRLQCLFGQLVECDELCPRQLGRRSLDICIDLFRTRGPRNDAGHVRFLHQPGERGVEHIELALLAELDDSVRQ